MRRVQKGIYMSHVGLASNQPLLADSGHFNQGLLKLLTFYELRSYQFTKETRWETGRHSNLNRKVMIGNWIHYEVLLSWRDRY
jgi:hypothetical protein